MAINKYYDSDCNLGVLDGKTVAVIGFGSQGHAHSENLAESGVNVVVGLRKGSAHWEKASEFAATHENFKVMEVEEAAKAGDVVMMLVPDELCADIYNTQVAPYMTEGKALAFAHGFNIHFKTITPPEERGRHHDRSQGPRPHRPPPVHRGRGLPVPDLRGAGLHRQGQGHCPGLRLRHRRRPRRHPARPPSRRRPRPTCSASRQCSAAASAS